MSKNTNPFGLRIGSPVWAFGSGDTPHAMHITGETSRSWVVSDGTKIPKYHATPVFDVSGRMSIVRYLLTREAADDMLLERMRWTLAHRVQSCTDPVVLRAVAAALRMPTGVIDKAVPS